MQVLILNSPLFKFSNKLYDEDSLPPLGLGYIASVLEENNISVKLIDAIEQRIPLNDLIELVEEINPKFLAINIFTTNCKLVKELIESIKIDIHIITGGLSTKQLYKEILGWETENPIDVVTGDGELITLDIVKNQLKEKPLIESGNRRVFKVDGNSKYIVKDISNIPLNRKFLSNEPIIHPLGFVEANIVTSRGCIYNCTFCAAARSLNKEYPIRERTNDSIIKELNEIKIEYPYVDSIRVLDDLFLKTNVTVEKAINVFSNFDFQWRSMAHVMTFNKVNLETMKLLKKSGCYELFIGIESGSPEILSSIKKTKNIEKIIENLTKVFQAGINMKGYFIYGFPNESLEDMEMTFQLAKKLKEISKFYNTNFRTSVFQYRPYHGTQIYHELESSGKNLNVLQVKPNQALSSLVGRLQFNLHSGNYSNVDSQVLNDYIYRTINLNNGKIFSGLRSKIKKAN